MVSKRAQDIYNITAIPPIYASGGAEAYISLGVPGANLEPDWWIDPVNGSDDASGTTELTPLRTHEELVRRVGTQILDIAVTVHLLNDFPADNPVYIPFTLGDGGFLSYLGEKSPTVLHAGSITGVVLTTPATNQQLEIEDTGLAADWGPSGLLCTSTSMTRIRITASTDPNNVGAIAYPTTDVGVKTARCGEFARRPAGPLPNVGVLDWFPSVIAVTPLVGDEYVIESDLTEIADLMIDLKGCARPGTDANFGIPGLGFRFMMRDCSLPGGNGLQPVVRSTQRGDAVPQHLFSGCGVGALRNAAGTPMMLEQCFLDGGNTGYDYEGTIFVYFGVCAGVMRLQAPCEIAFLLCDLGGRLASISVNETFIQSVGVFDAGDSAILLGDGARLSSVDPRGFGSPVLYGSGSIGYGILTASGAALVYDNLSGLTVTGALGDVNLGGFDDGPVRPYSEIPNANLIPTSLLCCGIKGAVTAGAVQYVEQNYLSSATDDLGWVAPVPGTVFLLTVEAGTAPGGAVVDAYAVLLNGVAAGVPATLATSLTGPATDATDGANRIPVSAGDRISVRLTSGGGSISANVKVSLVFQAAGGYDVVGGKIGTQTYIGPRF